MFTHESDNLVGYLDGGLEPEAERRVERHLETCHRCRTELADLRHAQRVLEAVGHGTPVPAYDTELWSRVHARIGKPRPTPRLRPRWALATGTLAMAVATTCFVVLMDQPPAKERMASAPEPSLSVSAKPADAARTLPSPSESTERTEGGQGAGGATRRPVERFAPTGPVRTGKQSVPAASARTLDEMARRPQYYGGYAVKPALPEPSGAPLIAPRDRIATRPPAVKPHRNLVARLEEAPSTPLASFGVPVTTNGPVLETNAARAMRGREAIEDKGAGVSPYDVHLYDAPVAAIPPPGAPPVSWHMSPDASAVGTRTRTADADSDRQGADSMYVDLTKDGISSAIGNRNENVLSRGTALGVPDTTAAGGAFASAPAPEVVAGPPADYGARFLRQNEDQPAQPTAKVLPSTLPYRPQAPSTGPSPRKAVTVLGDTVRPATAEGRRAFAQANKEFAAGRTQKAVEGFRTALSAGITVTEKRIAHLRLGDASVRAKDDATALREYTAAIEIAKDAEVLAKLGGVYERLGEDAKAKNAYEQALMFNQGYDQARAGLARIKAKER